MNRTPYQQKTNKITCWKIAVFATALASGCLSLFAKASANEISSLKELAEYASQSNQTVKMKPGVYRMIDFIPLDQIPELRKSEAWHFIHFTGSNNTFDLTDVTIEVDTRLRAELRAPIHNPEFLVSGNNNILQGLTITNIGNGTSNAGNVLSIHGDGNTLRDCTLHVQGSYPYGYGDLFGKGGPGVIPHRKHSGVQITGDNNRIIGCTLYMRSFGHGFYIQGATNTYFEHCYVEGEMRPTDEMLTETSGPAFEADFRSVYRNREGEERVAPGYMKTLAEDAFRTYGNTSDVTFINCTAKNMRAAFELRTSGPIHIENSKAIGNERGFWVGSDAVIKNSRGDAQYGPLLFMEGENSSVEVQLMPEESEMNVHALATIHGSGHKVSITLSEGRQRSQPIPIKLGFSQPGGGEGMSPFSERAARNITLINATRMPVIIGQHTSNSEILSQGEVIENAGESISIRNYTD